MVQYIRLAAADGDKDARNWLHVWDDLKPWEQHQVTFDDVCCASGCSPVKFIKILAGTAFETHSDIANLIAALAHPRVIEASTKFAQHADGIEDRKLLMQHARFIPIPKGTTINVGISASAQAAAAASSEPSVPSFADDMDIADGPKLLTEGEVIEEFEKEEKSPIEVAWEKGSN